MKWKETHDNEYYIRCFNEQVLNKLNIQNVIRDLIDLIPEGMSDKSIALICYEKPEDFCHRHLVAKWFNDNGINCKEWIKNQYTFDPMIEAGFSKETLNETIDHPLDTEFIKLNSYIKPKINADQKNKVRVKKNYDHDSKKSE